MKASEFKDLSLEELKTRLADSKKELFNLKFQHARGQLEKNSRLREIKREVARILTIITEKSRSLKV